MHDEPEKIDRRAGRTQDALRKALIGLILEKRYDSITVQDIIDRANVGRSTFYAHFKDQDDLFLRDIERVLNQVAQHIDWSNVSEPHCVPIRELFTHVQDFERFFKALARSRKVDWFYRNGRRILAQCLETSLTKALVAGTRPGVPIPIIANYLAGSMLDMLRWWVDHDMPESPERMDQVFHELVLPGVRQALAGIEFKVN
ncbi:MAG: TetR/AcrR family transcriptional regulator [Pyrinomonadaceae bacterium]